MNLVTCIASNELRHSLRNRSLLIACVSVAALLLLPALIAQLNQAKLNAQRDEFQQQVRSNWLEQPDRHPHRASHYGYLAFRPKAPLSFFDSGVDSFAGTSVFLEPHRQNTANFSEANHSGGMLRFGELSPALVLQLLVPLAIFFLGFAALTGERESGTLAMLLAQGVTWRALIVGKTLGVAAMALLITAPGALLLLGWCLFSGHEFSRDTLWRTLGLLMGYSLYLLICAVFAVLVSAWQQTSRGALTSLILLWILFCVVIPRGAQTLGSAIAPTPAKAEFDAALELATSREGDSHKPDDPHFAALCSQPIAPPRVLAMKAALRFMPIVAVWWLTLLAAVLWLRLPLDRRIGFVTLISLAYLLFWFATSWFVMSFNRSSNFNALSLLAVWLMLTMLLPATLNVVLATFLPVPEAFAVTVKQREGYHQQWDRPKAETMQRFFQRYPEYAAFQAPADKFSWGWYYAVQHLGDADAAESSAQLRAKLQQRQQWMRRLAWVVPTINAQTALNQIAQTELENHLAYLDSVRSFHEQMRRYFYPVLMRNDAPPPMDWQQLPRHQFHDEAQTPGFPVAALSLLAISVGLALWSQRRR
jgi:ABC-type transport system involved in multi-copper enzyme maturation permease subunit